MKLEDQVVSLELAKKLKKLGVPQTSYFKWVRWDDDDGDTPFVLRPPLNNGEYVDTFSAFTVAELGEMLPWYLPEPEEFYLQCSKHDEGQREVCYDREDAAKILHLEVADNEADARAKMLIYLIENNLLDIAAINTTV